MASCEEMINSLLDNQRNNQTLTTNNTEMNFETPTHNNTDINFSNSIDHSQSLQSCTESTYDAPTFLLQYDNGDTSEMITIDASQIEYVESAEAMENGDQSNEAMENGDQSNEAIENDDQLHEAMENCDQSNEAVENGDQSNDAMENCDQSTTNSDLTSVAAAEPQEKPVSTLKKFYACRWCSAIRCTNSRMKNPELAFLSFPRDEYRCKVWITNCRRQDLLAKSALYLSTHNVLCSAHFEDSQFTRPPGPNTRKRLLTWAIPTIFTPKPPPPPPPPPPSPPPPPKVEKKSSKSNKSVKQPTISKGKKSPLHIVTKQPATKRNGNLAVKSKIQTKKLTKQPVRNIKIKPAPNTNNEGATPVKSPSIDKSNTRSNSAKSTPTNTNEQSKTNKANTDAKTNTRKTLAQILPTLHREKRKVTRKVFEYSEITRPSSAKPLSSNKSTGDKDSPNKRKAPNSDASSSSTKRRFLRTQLPQSCIYLDVDENWDSAYLPEVKLERLSTDDIGMGAGKMRIALIQQLVGKSKASNLQRCRELIKSAAEKGAKLVALPECFNSPYGTKFFAEYAERIPGETTKVLSCAAKEHNIFLVGGSIPEIDDGKLYNTSTVYNTEGEMVAKHRKVHLFDIDIPGKITFKESEVLSPGNNYTTFDMPGCKVGVGICYDVRFPNMAQVYAQKGCKLLIYPGAFNLITGPVHWHLLNRATALNNQLYMGAVSPATDRDAEYTAYGHSCIVNPWGEIMAGAEHDETTIFADIDLDYVDQVRQQIPISYQKRDDLYALKDMTI